MFIAVDMDRPSSSRMADASFFTSGSILMAGRAGAVGELTSDRGLRRAGVGCHEGAAPAEPVEVSAEVLGGHSQSAGPPSRYSSSIPFYRRILLVPCSERPLGS